MLIVQKYGGTSVADPDRIRNVARRVARTKSQGHDVVVVVSAMAGETNKLVDLVGKISEGKNLREYDVVVSTGEQVTIGLMALALESLGLCAVSFLGFQVPIITDKSYSKARITRIKTHALKKALVKGIIPVVAGFQGIEDEGDVTTLGRGGSDTTAVALAAALKADKCEVYSDVEGIYTTDPSICPEARLLDKISYEEMLEMASLGAKVLQVRSVELAMRWRVPLVALSSFSDAPGTLITEEEKDSMKRPKGTANLESASVSGVTYDKSESKITVVRVPDKPGIAAKLFTALSDAAINVDMIVQNVSTEGFTDLTFTVARTDLKRALEHVRRVAKEIGAEDVRSDENIAKVSIVGAGMRSHAGVASLMFRTLAKEGINIMMISTSEIKISCVIETKYTELAVRVLHEVFGLGKKKK